ncbi:MAG TPA: F0F1 ATP synthase subunit B [Longimicrobiaceae bacterium]|jgi:F-type H+-transporting ATPase subunit b|nr:F0F1 ATP synthase subunit B [Longimicrobiaceae bacterium]
MRRYLAVLTALVLGSAAPLHAQERGLLDPSFGLMIWTIVIFVLVLAILYWTAYPAILGAVDAREAHIRELAEATERDRAEAARLREEQERLLEETRQRTQDAIAEGRAVGERVREEIVAAAHRDREELMARAHRDIESERQNALEAVRRDAVDLAMAAAEKLVRRSLATEDNRRMVLDYLGQVQVERLPAATGA